MTSVEAHAPRIGGGDSVAIGVVGQATLVLTTAILAIGLFTMGVVLPRMAGTAGGQAWLLPWIGSIASPISRSPRPSRVSLPRDGGSAGCWWPGCSDLPYAAPCRP